MKRLLDVETTYELPTEIWQLIVQYLPPGEARNLIQTCHLTNKAFQSISLQLKEAMALKIWHVERTDAGGWDSYSNFVCCCATEWEARSFHPSEQPPVCRERSIRAWLMGKRRRTYKSGWLLGRHGRADWIRRRERGQLKVTLLGIAVQGQGRDIICSSYHAG
jgi:hypothetical protein